MSEHRFNYKYINYLLVGLILLANSHTTVTYAREVIPTKLVDAALKARYVPTVIENLPPVELKIAPTSPEDLIRHYSKLYGIDPTLPLKIAYAESQYKNVPNYKYDGESGRYTAFGIFQFLKSTWITYCSPNPLDRMDIEKNIECGVKMIANGQESHWNESRGAWEL